MLIKTLRQKHPTYDAERWEDLYALAKGGKRFHNLLSKFLPRNPQEPDNIYRQRTQNAHYTSYTGSIINLYTSWLFAANFSIKPYKRDTEEPIDSPHPFYGQFQEDVGAETTLTDFMKERFREALTCTKAYWLVELPSNGGQPASDAADYEARDLGRATLKAIDSSEVLDWEIDDNGNYIWVVVYTNQIIRRGPGDDRTEVIETWRVYERETVTTYESRYKKGQKPSDNTEIAGTTAGHGFHQVPLICLDVQEELCIGEQTHDAQIEHFRLENALSWLIRRTCYCQPVFKVDDAEKLPTMGTGYAIVIGSEDDFMWTAPPNAPFDVLQNNVDAKRDQIYRIVHQMAQGLDNNAETVGRSADSKEIDAAATRIMLNAYGSFVSKAVEETLELISEARNEKDYEWSVEGFSGYDTATVTSLLANSRIARDLGIPSQKFHKELCAKTALALLPEADQRVKDTIRKEIEAATFPTHTETVDMMAVEVERAKGASLDAKATLDQAKAKAEPVKAAAAMKSASRPQPKPSLPAKK